jgi:predicted metal-dependent peptidase
MAKKHNKPIAPNPADAAYQTGVSYLNANPIFSPLLMRVRIHRKESHQPVCPRDGWAVITENGDLHVHPYRLAEPEEWEFILAHCLLHLAFGHFQGHTNTAAWNAACDYYVTRFLHDLKLGSPHVEVVPTGYPRQEEALYRYLCDNGIPDELKGLSTSNHGGLDMVFDDKTQSGLPYNMTWEAVFARGLQNAVESTVNRVSNSEGYHASLTQSGRARRWFINHYPLLASLAASFKVIESVEICHRYSISVGAVDAELGEIYINPAANLSDAECRFVMAHELLHVALRHHARRKGRDPFLWNVACDYVINAWLIEMGVGDMPTFGLLYDPELKGMNAEAIYDLIVTDMRRNRKLATLRGFGLGDMLGESEWWKSADGMKLDEFYRRALSQGLNYCDERSRGYLPAGLIEEINALSQPPIPWDVELAQWFDEHFPPIEKVRSYARPSRRQSSTPDIPRPRYVPDPRTAEGYTFGVVLDTSGSMDRELLAKSLGAIASYSIAHEVGHVRVVFCDAHPYDQGYLIPEDIAGRVKVKGRGGTILQPGINLLHRADDFPPDAPILIITDTECDRLSVPRDHAYLIPDGKNLPFPPKGQVFYVMG